MKIINSIKEMSAVSALSASRGQSIGFVPTMGYLHAGHLSLMKTAREENELIVVSIFVNPTQFAPNEDLACYPKNTEADIASCEKMGVDIIFAPCAQEMYPDGFGTYVNPSDLATRLCGVTRPDHFRGVCTVVAKLFNIIRPTNAYFGQKDAQQFFILCRMVQDLNMGNDLTMHRLPIIRESDGLAMSSRNVYLDGQERKQAVVLHQALAKAQLLYDAGERQVATILEAMKEQLAKAPLAKVDYLQIVDTMQLLPVDKIEEQVLVAIAVYFGSTRLIDNIILG